MFTIDITYVQNVSPKRVPNESRTQRCSVSETRTQNLYLNHIGLLVL